MTKHAEFFAALAAPFKPREVKQLKKGKTISYVTARTVMNRLDEVVGPEGWWDDYFPGAESVICRLTIVLPDGKEITKVDAGGYAGMADSGDDDKSGFSDAFKRAAVKFGVSRYLYEDGVPNFAQGQSSALEQRSPAREPASRPAGQQEPRQAPQTNGNGQGGPPRSGKALFAWIKEQEQVHSVGLIKYINAWAKLKDFPGRMVDWDVDQVAQSHAESVRKLAAVGKGEEAARPASQNGIHRDPPREGPPDTKQAPAVVTIAQAKKFEERVNAYCKAVNDKWLDKHTDSATGECMATELINTFQLTNHMLKAAGIVFADGGKFNDRMRAATGLWLADEAGTLAGWKDYVATLASKAEAKPEAPVTANAGREPGCDDDR